MASCCGLLRLAGVFGVLYLRAMLAVGFARKRFGLLLRSPAVVLRLGWVTLAGLVRPPGVWNAQPTPPNAGPRELRHAEHINHVLPTVFGVADQLLPNCVHDPIEQFERNSVQSAPDSGRESRTPRPCTRGLAP